jgi:short-subunit dehydrogenase
VVLAARRVAELEQQAHAITAAGGVAIAIPTDVADAAQVTRLVERAREAYGAIDVLVNNAGVGWTKLLVNSSSEEISRVLEINLLGAMLLTRAVLPGMLERRQGAIISVGSVAGQVAIEPLYSASKYGLRGFSLALRRQVHHLAGNAISVSLVLPGNIRTRMTSDLQERMPEPEVVATTIADLVLHPRREVVIPRKHYAVVWLEQALPALSDLAYQWRHRHGLRAQ